MPRPSLNRGADMKLLKTIKCWLSEDYKLAQQKREFERYLRACGWTKKQALAEVARKFPSGGDRERG